jgi:hypothetical protein
MENKTKLADGVYLVEKNNDFNIIRPPKKDLDKPFTKDNIHWGNLIGLKHNWFSIFIILMLIVSALAYKHDISACQEIVKNPYKICGFQFQQANITYITNMTNFWSNVTFVSENITYGGKEK